MMDSKENTVSSPTQVKQMTEEDATAAPVPTLRERMHRLMQLRSAWDSEDSTVSPLRQRHERNMAAPRQSLNPDSGQVNHMKEKFARLAEELRTREDEEPKSPRPLTTQTVADAELEKKKRRWTPPSCLSQAPQKPGSPILRSRSPSPSRAEMPNSPRGGASGTVERPKPTPVSARKATWEEQIATANETARTKGRIGKTVKSFVSPPILPRTPIITLENKRCAPSHIAAVDVCHSPAECQPGMQDIACRKESVRKHKGRQNDMKYEAGLAAVGFEVSSERKDVKVSGSVSRERSLKRKSEDSSKRPVQSSLLRIISQPTAETDSVAEKKARMLNLMTPSSFCNPHDHETPKPSSTLESTVPGERAESEKTFSDTNSLFADDEDVGLPRLNSFMEDMWRAERRASMGEETMTEVTTETNTESEFEYEDVEMEAVVEQQQPEEEEVRSVRSEDVSSVQVEVASMADDLEVDAEDPEPSSPTVTTDDGLQHDETTRQKFFHFLEQREKSDAAQSLLKPQPSPRSLRRGRRSSSMSDLTSPLLRRPSTVGRLRYERSKACLAYTVEGYRSTVLEGRLSPPAPRVYSLNFSDIDADCEGVAEPSERRERLVMGVAPRLDTKRIGSYEQQAAQQEEVIYQASKALHQVMANGRTGSAQHIECSRVLVVACQKRQALLEEASRLRQCGAGSLSASSACCVLTLSGVRLVLKASYRQRIQTQQQLLQQGAETDVEQHYFICLLKLPGGRVHATEVTCTGTNIGPSARDFIEIPSCLTLKDLPQGFTARLEVYGLSLSRTENRVGTSPSKDRTPRRLLRRLRGGKHGSGLKGGLGTSSASPGAWTAHTGFSLMSSVRLTPESVGQSVFPLLRLPAMSPLDGIVQLRLRVTSEPRIERRGFMSIFAEVGGFGSWLRRWCSLRRDWLLMWNYPDEESSGVPAHHALSLRQCVTRRVELLTKEECARPFTMRLHLLRTAKEGETDNLVITRQGDAVLEKFLLSAESRREQMEWADSLNDCLFMMRQFHADQFRALETKAQSFLSL